MSFGEWNHALDWFGRKPIPDTQSPTRFIGIQETRKRTRPRVRVFMMAVTKMLSVRSAQPAAVHEERSSELSHAATGSG